jgi:hypothetical protein
MADNTARAREQLAGQRKAVSDHIAKWARYKEPHDKNFALKTIRNAQTQIEKLKKAHPSLAKVTEPEDTWSPPS